MWRWYTGTQYMDRFSSVCVGESRNTRSLDFWKKGRSTSTCTRSSLVGVCSCCCTTCYLPLRICINIVKHKMVKSPLKISLCLLIAGHQRAMTLALSMFTVAMQQLMQGTNGLSGI